MKEINVENEATHESGHQDQFIRPYDARAMIDTIEIESD